MNYYNEFDPKAAAWIRELIKAGFIPEGIVDERTIKSVRPDELVGFRQCHFFAGIAGWSRALQLANWDSAREVWTGSCPCQPLSCAGKRGGEKDERHLWPEFYRLISECRPATVFGEQVASADGLEWLDGVSLDLEELGYAVAASDLPSAGVGAPNKRQRGWWVANAISTNEQQWPEAQWLSKSARRGPPCRLVQSNSTGLVTREPSTETAGHGGSTEPASGVGLADANNPRPQGRDCGILSECSDERAARTGGSSSFWDNAIWHPCSDGKIRRIPPEPAFFPLAPGLPGRVAMLRGFGNAINPEVASQFIQAFLEAERDLTQT